MEKTIKFALLTLTLFLAGIFNHSMVQPSQRVTAQETHDFRVGYVVYTLNDPFQNY